MRRIFLVLGCLSILALPLLLNGSAHAQATLPLPDGAQAAPHSSDDLAGHAERREMREERQRLRAEHEALETEGDKLKVECMDAKGQDHALCEDKRHAIHEKMAELHGRMKLFHEKAGVERHEREARGHHDKDGDGKEPQQAGDAAAPAHP